MKFTISSMKVSKIVAVMGGLFVASVASAWTGPPAGTPPNCPAASTGCSTPINVSATGQTKTGAFAATPPATQNAVSGTASGASGWGGFFTGQSGVYGAGTTGVGVNGTSVGSWAGNFVGTLYGAYGQGSQYGLYGHSPSGTAGVYGWSPSSAGVRGDSTTDNGVRGISQSGPGVRGDSQSSNAVEGHSTSGWGGNFAGNTYGVYGQGGSGGYGVYAVANGGYAVFGSNGSQSAFLGFPGWGVYTDYNAYASDVYLASVGRWASQPSASGVQWGGTASIDGGWSGAASCPSYYVVTSVFSWHLGGGNPGNNDTTVTCQYIY